MNADAKIQTTKISSKEYKPWITAESVNPDKSVVVLFSKKHKPQKRFLKFSGKLIKHGGVILDRRLNFRKLFIGGAAP